MSAAETTKPLSRAPLNGRRVLVIEDEYFIADDIMRGLTSFGAEIVGPIPEMEEVVRVLNRGEPIDAAVLDINIRDQMIFPIARELRARRIPFVFTTGYDRNTIAAEFQDVQLWEKPLDIPRIARSLAKIIPER